MRRARRRLAEKAIVAVAENALHPDIVEAAAKFKDIMGDAKMPLLKGGGLLLSSPQASPRSPRSPRTPSNASRGESASPRRGSGALTAAADGSPPPRPTAWIQAPPLLRGAGLPAVRPSHAARSPPAAGEECFRAAVARMSQVKGQVTKKRNSLDSLRHSISREERMKNLDNARLVKKATRELSRKEGHFAWQAFNAYAYDMPREKGRGVMGTALVVEALADFGVQAHTRAERLQLEQALPDLEEDEPINFRDFCHVVVEARERLQASMTRVISHAWKTVSPGGGAQLDRDGLVALLLELSPVGSADLEEQTRLRGVVEDFAREPSEWLSGGPPNGRSLAWTKPGHFGLQEARRAAWLARERRESRRREKERDLKRRHDLAPDLFREFRGQLVEFHDLFDEALTRQREASGEAPPAPPPLQDFDEGRQIIPLPCKEESAAAPPRLQAREVRHIMGRLGVSVPPPAVGKRASLVDEGPGAAGLEEAEGGAPSDGEGLPLAFGGMLARVRARRDELMRERHYLVEDIFKGCKKNSRGELAMEEVCRIVCRIVGEPGSLSEQHDVAQLIDAFDADSSGTLSFSELVLLIQRVEEKLNQQRQSREDSRAEQMNFSREEVNCLRDAFGRHSYDGGMSHGQAEKAVGVQLNFRLSQRSLRERLEAIDPGGEGLSFVGFMELVRSIHDKQGRTGTAQRSGDAGHGNPSASHDGSSPATPSPRTAEDAAFEAEDAAQKRTMSFAGWASRASRAADNAA